MRRITSNLKVAIIVGVALGVLASCEIASPTSIADTKVSIISQYGSNVQVSVYLEGSDGNYLTGARVSVTNPANEVQILGFNETMGCYFGTFTDLLSGTYAVKIWSALLASPENFSIDHEVPDGAPTVSQCSDASGDNALTGQTLNANEAITLRWSTLDNVTAYSVQVNQNAIQAYASSADGGTITIPANILATGSYTIKLTAQWLAGDPYLLNTDTYSASQSQSSSFALTVQ